MGRIKYGIDLGTTNSAISKIEKGESLIIKSDNQGDTTPSCVGYRKKGSVMAGERAFNTLKSDKLKALKSGKSSDSNFWVEFKRTMGSDKKYHSSIENEDFNSEQLSSEVLKKLKSYLQDEVIKSAVITIPAMFNDNQKSATLKAAELAGISQTELLQEPIAAAMAYGMDEKQKDGELLIFDFGGGTFDVCLVKMEDGIMQVKDTDGDNWLGGKTLDNAIVDELLIPYFKDNYSIQSYLDDEEKNLLLKDALKIEAEKIKIELSFNKTCDVISDLGVYPNDDNGEEIEIDLTVSQSELEKVVTPIFQKAVDISLEVLKRNNIDGKSLASLILVGGPTFSPVLRSLVEKQIKKPNTSVDPMTIVARGAAIYATQFEVSEEIVDQTRDKTKIQLELSYESQSVEVEEMLVVKLNEEKTEGEIPKKLNVSVKRGDGAWESDKSEFDATGEIIDLSLVEGKPNIFEIIVTNEGGDKLDCEPTEITIIQGVKAGNATLAYSYGVEALGENGKANFFSFIGLEKGVTMPASGQKTGLKTVKDIRPGTDDEINISIYQGGNNAENTRAINHNYVHTVKLSGNDIPKLLPKNSEVNLFLEVISDGKMNMSVDLPYLNDTIEISIEKQEQKEEDDQWFEDKIAEIEAEIIQLEEENESIDSEAINIIRSEVEDAKNNYKSRKNDYDTRMKTRDDLRKAFTKLDNLELASSWPNIEKDLKEAYYKLEELNKEKNNQEIGSELSRIKTQMETVINNKDSRMASELTKELSGLIFNLFESEHGVALYIAILQNFNDDFNSQPWTDKSKARSILNKGLAEAASNPSKERIVSYCRELWQLLPNPKGSSRDDILGN
ncbi:MAG: Hsp70 family protein [Flavobacteriales bacterium]